MNGAESAADEREALLSGGIHQIVVGIALPEEETAAESEAVSQMPFVDLTLGGTANTGPLLYLAGEEETPVPEYVLAEADAVAQQINSRKSGSIITFPFLSDAHCGFYKDKANAAPALAGQLLNRIGTEVDYSFIVYGGDVSTGAWDTTRVLTFAHFDTFSNLLKYHDSTVPALWVMGNHDDSPYRQTEDRLSQMDTYGLVGSRNRNIGVEGPEGCNYGYLDLEDLKLRVILLDTDDKRGLGSVTVGAGEPGPAYLNAHNVGPEQLRWLANTALDFSEKEHCEEWGVVVISHVPLNVSGWVTDPVSGEGFAHSTIYAAGVLSAYKNGGKYYVNHNGETVTADFSDIDERAEIICAVHGHEHRFSDALLSGILSIGCPNVMNGRERRSDDGKIYEKTPDSADGTSFCIISIDRENKKIYADCVGVGYDRTYSY